MTMSKNKWGRQTMKSNIYSTILILTILISTCFAQDNIQVGLPDGAIARLGKGGINVMQFSPDGMRLAVGTTIGVWIYDVEHGTERVLPLDAPKYITNLAFSSDGEMLAFYGGFKDGIHLWKLDTNNLLTTLPFDIKRYGLPIIVFSENNTKLIGLGNKAMIEWVIVTGEQNIIEINNQPLSALAFTKDGKSFVSGDRMKGEIRKWDPITKNFSHAFHEKRPSGFELFLTNLFGSNSHEKNSDKGVIAIAVSPDGKTVASAHANDLIQLWDTATKSEKAKLKGHTEMINVLSFSPDNTLLASCGDDSTIILWDVRKGRRRSILKGHQGNLNTLAFSPTDNRLLASGSIDGTVRFWDTKKGKERSIFATGHPEAVESIIFNKKNDLLYSAISNGSIQIWDVQTGKEHRDPILAQKDMFYTFVFSKDATLFASHGAETIVYAEGGYSVIDQQPHKKTHLMSLPDGKKVVTFQQDTYPLDIDISPDNKMLAANIKMFGENTKENRVQLWNINSNKKMFGWIVEDSIWRELIFSPSSNILVAYGMKTKTQVWDVTTKREITPPDITEANVIVFSPDGTSLAIKHTDGIVLWDINSIEMQKIKTITKDKFYANDKLMIFSPDGKILLDKSRYDNQVLIRLWDIDTGKELGTHPTGHTSDLESLVFSHDGKILASASIDGTIILWDWEKFKKNIKVTKENNK